MMIHCSGRRFLKLPDLIITMPEPDATTLAPTLSATTESAPTSADDTAESAATNLLISKRQVFGHAPLHNPEGHTCLQGALDWRTGTWWHQPPPTTTPTLMRTTITTDTDEHRLTSTTKEEARPVSKTSLHVGGDMNTGIGHGAASIGAARADPSPHGSSGTPRSC